MRPRARPSPLAVTEVFPSYELLGWYAVGNDAVGACDIQLHTAMAKYNEAPLFVHLRPSLAAGARELPLAAYTLEFHAGGAPAAGETAGALGSYFSPVAIRVEATESERLTMDHCTSLAQTQQPQPQPSSASALTAEAAVAHGTAAAATAAGDESAAARAAALPAHRECTHSARHVAVEPPPIRHSGQRARPPTTTPTHTRLQPRSNTCWRCTAVWRASTSASAS